MSELTNFERNEMAMLYGLVTAAYIAKKNGYSFHDYMRAAMLSWESEKSDPSRDEATSAVGSTGCTTEANPNERAGR